MWLLSGMREVGYLFNVQKIFGLKVDSRALDWALLVQYTTVADIGPHSKCHGFVLENLVISANEGSLRAPLLVSVSHQQRAGRGRHHLPITHTHNLSHSHTSCPVTLRDIGQSTDSIQPGLFCPQPTSKRIPWPSRAAAEPGSPLHAGRSPGPPLGRRLSPEMGGWYRSRLNPATGKRL